MRVRVRPVHLCLRLGPEPAIPVSRPWTAHLSRPPAHVSARCDAVMYAEQHREGGLWAGPRSTVQLAALWARLLSRPGSELSAFLGQRTAVTSTQRQVCEAPTLCHAPGQSRLCGVSTV